MVTMPACRAARSGFKSRYDRQTTKHVQGSVGRQARVGVSVRCTLSNGLMVCEVPGYRCSEDQIPYETVRACFIFCRIMSFSVNDYIRSGGHSLDAGIRASRRYSVLESFYPRGIVPPDVQNRFGADPRFDFINENLNTHDYNIMMKAVERYLGDHLDNWSLLFGKDHELDMIELFFPSFIVSEMYLDDPGLKDVLDFYGYYVTHIEDNTILIEPKYSRNMSSYIYGECRGIIFHMTDVNNIPSIMRSGLRTKTASYRIFPRRVYVFADPDIKDVNDSIFAEYAPELMERPENLSVLKLDVRGMDIDFYQDLAMDRDGVFFTYTNLPASCIKACSRTAK